MIFMIARSPEGGEITRYDRYELLTTKRMTVLDVLFSIQDDVDPSLSFRYSCRGAVCGSCAMLIDKVPRLACRTQVDAIKQSTLGLRVFPAIEISPVNQVPDSAVLIEPLPNFPILKDLVIDMASFHQSFELMKLWANPTEGVTARAQIPEELSRFDRYANCISCAICHASCPVCASHPEFVGPAPLAKAWRFYEDSRLVDRGRYLESAKQPVGAPMCELVMNCVKACPKDVAPGGAIKRIKDIT
jgi:succinate dehydrogenase / fumarate reductase iron-sulfur subunit